MTDLSEIWPVSGSWDDGGIWSDGPIVPSILPTSATEFERSIEAASARIQTFPDYIRPIWDADTCPQAILPWLAWAMSVDDWSAAWSVETKREVIRQSVWVHQRKGTIGAIKRALVAAGYGDATVIERAGGSFHDGAADHDGTIDYGPADHWAEYRVTMARPITNAQADVIRSILASVAPLRCHLKVLDFQEVAYLHNASIRYDGAVNYGAA